MHPHHTIASRLQPTPNTDETLTNGCIVYWTQRQISRVAVGLKTEGKVFYKVPVYCSMCATTRLVRQGAITSAQRHQTFTGLCASCCGRVWRYGHPAPQARFVTKHGYVMVGIPHDHPLAALAAPWQHRQGFRTYFVFEHRLLMSEQLGRPLERWEHVHHKNGIPSDNRLENLEVLTADVHAAVTRLSAELSALRAENRRLRDLLGACPFTPTRAL